MLYTEKEKNEIERVRKVFEKHIQQMTAYDLVWSDKVGYVWLAISIDPVYIDTGNWIESRCSGLCYECMNDIAGCSPAARPERTSCWQRKADGRP